MDHPQSEASEPSDTIDDHSGHGPAHDEAGKQRLLARLRRIEGQVRGLQRMVETERYCPDILHQVTAVQASLGATAEALLQGHLRHCVTTALRSGDGAAAERMYGELAELYRRSR